MSLTTNVCPLGSVGLRTSARPPGSVRLTPNACPPGTVSLITEACPPGSVSLTMYAGQPRSVGRRKVLSVDRRWGRRLVCRGSRRRSQTPISQTLRLFDWMQPIFIRYVRRSSMPHEHSLCKSLCNILQLIFLRYSNKINQFIQDEYPAFSSLDMGDEKARMKKPVPLATGSFSSAHLGKHRRKTPWHTG